MFRIPFQPFSSIFNQDGGGSYAAVIGKSDSYGHEVCP